MMYLEQDVLKILDKMISQYEYHTTQCNNTSCTTTGYIVIEKNNTILGCIGIDDNAIKHLRIIDNYKRQGLGKYLLNKAENIIIKRGYDTALTFVHINNIPANKFFTINKYFPVSCGEYYTILEKGLRI